MNDISQVMGYVNIPIQRQHKALLIKGYNDAFSTNSSLELFFWWKESAVVRFHPYLVSLVINNPSQDCCMELGYSLNRIEQGLANFVFKGPKSKYFLLYYPTQAIAAKQPEIVCKWVYVVACQKTLYLKNKNKKQVADWIWLTGYSLPTDGREQTQQGVKPAFRWQWKGVGQDWGF